jgi:putative hemin transport protein
MERAAPALWQAYEALKREQPRLRARDAARQLHISEAELVAADPASTPLRDDDWPGLLGELA